MKYLVIKDLLELKTGQILETDETGRWLTTPEGFVLNPPTYQEYLQPIEESLK
ncbi:MAG: hypothetical protein BWY41_00122 [Candidatus Atribacteria bacterium ADurb.Bin276]|uniref:Uncharacterized protein n=1 Tax=Candidatus Atribacter allofermentans TaxID=1852833 RepID=A0A1V5T5D6_9BACT|nr:MAG: hypothetical protein BWY41_00122 [Candidatus Atribacteria bacterium ADurb.Bin276]